MEKSLCYSSKNEQLNWITHCNCNSCKWSSSSQAPIFHAVKLLSLNWKHSCISLKKILRCFLLRFEFEVCTYCCCWKVLFCPEFMNYWLPMQLKYLAYVSIHVFNIVKHLFWYVIWWRHFSIYINLSNILFPLNK